jgi:hypothetical protein
MDISSEMEIESNVQDLLQTLFSLEATFTYVPSIIPAVIRPPIRTPIRTRLSSRSRPFIPPLPWAERRLTCPDPSFIRLLEEPRENPHGLKILWDTDYTLTEWHTMIDKRRIDLSNNPYLDAFDLSGQIAFMCDVFATNQRMRWLARVVQRKWTQRVWRKRTQCNVDMIDMAPIPDVDAVFMTDTRHRQIFRFHRSDVFSNLLSNICASDEMLPTPRAPRNPWNNMKLTLAQIMGLCAQLVQDFAKKGMCPPVLFAAYWASRFDLGRFESENSALLSQHAIRAYFKDLNPDNIYVFEETIMNLLTAANLDYSTTAIRRWVNLTQQTELHLEWLALVRDYTLYMNLHVQARPTWHSIERIYVDVVRLYDRMILPPSAPTRIRNPVSRGISIVFPNSLLDISGSAMLQDTAIQLIQNALFR